MSDVDVHLLISLVEERPVLWDTSDEAYKDKFVKQEAWKSVCEIIYDNYNKKRSNEKSKLGTELVKKWKAIKDNFAKYQKKLKDSSRSGAGASKIKEYHLNKQLQFLKKVTQNETDSSIRQHVTEGGSKKRNESTAMPSYQNPPRKRKTDKRDESQDDKIKMLKTPENRHLCFFKGILPSLKTLNDHQTLIFQSRVLQILTDLHLPSIQENSHQCYTKGYTQGYPTLGYQSTYQSGYTSTPGVSESSNSQRPINSPPLDVTSASSYCDGIFVRQWVESTIPAFKCERLKKFSTI